MSSEAVHDVRIGLVDKTILHFPQADIEYYPSPDVPRLLRVKSKHLSCTLEYSIVDYVFPDWGKTADVIEVALHPGVGCWIQNGGQHGIDETNDPQPAGKRVRLLVRDRGGVRRRNTGVEVPAD